MIWLRRMFVFLIAAGVVAALVFAMQPKPVLVDVATIARGPLVVTISDDGRTRIRERYVVSAPLSGRLVRIGLDPGDEVVARQTHLTTIEPTDPTLLDPRAIALAQARVKAAEARVSQARPRLASALETLNLEEAEMGRLQQLAKKNAVSEQELNRQTVAFRKAQNDYSAARFEVEIAEFELAQAKAALLRTDSSDDNSEIAEWSFPITSPISGRVLRVFQESATIVKPGDRIMELGDPADLEVEVDVLSTDAVKIPPGARVMLNEWGGDKSLEARVRLVEPSAFTKVSALGIEEQRVNVIIDFVDPPETRTVLGDGFRVEADIVRWEADDVLTVPTGALFREGGQWSVFVISSDNITELQPLELGHRNDDAAEVLNGLTEGDSVVLYPGDRVSIGTLVGRRD
ncbi:efflux RND transporter periplasmic adaptor subunit [Fuerstiella marisgermanici]|uniref:Efflux system component YknX n=1 Tax=Fuerstiella marisgermanici TaxID=1891926 RepID=A0A1P8WJR4_9PLAN|nr:HlyD family efflux transporter periplasmic adaptor subunit [Fuerstiella marisgermanici]APZ94295.1 Putative efflux system component YknX [Fuerstiella marisgermanici]